MSDSARQDGWSRAGLLFVFATDVHYPHDGGGLAQFVRTVNEMEDKCAFVVLGGDSIDSGEICYAMSADRVNELYQSYAPQVAAITRPCFMVMGDHDLASALDPSLPEYHAGAYHRYFGQTYYSFDRGDVRFIVLDPYPHGCTWDRATIYQLDWLAAELAAWGRSKPVILFTHQPPFDVENYDAFLECIRGYNVLGAFSGHAHANRIETIDGLTHLVTGTLAGRVTVFAGDQMDNPPGYRLCSVKNGKLDTFYASLSNPHHVNVITPRWRALDRGSVEITAKVLDLPNELTHVYCRVGDHPFVPMEPDEGHLWKTWRRTVKLPRSTAGVLDLEILPATDYEAWPYRGKVVVDTDEAYQAREGASARVTVSAGRGEYEFQFNGISIGRIVDPAEARPLTFEIEPKLLRRMNTLSVHALGNQPMSRSADDLIRVSDFSLHHRGQTYTDQSVIPGFGYVVGTWCHAPRVLPFYAAIRDEQSPP